jgi:Anti-sigma-K factor rskA
VTDDGRDEREELSAEVRAALTPDGIRADTRARLLSRAATDAQLHGQAPGGAPASRGVAPAPTASRGRGVPVPLFTVAALALAASLVFMVKLKNDASSERAAFAAADRAYSRRLDSLSAALAARDQLVSSLTGAQVRVVGLSSSETRNPHALMFWDKATDRWTFIAHKLAPLPPGRTYQLWLVTDAKKISAGTFGVSPSGDAFVQATYPLDSGALKAVAVTEEPAGGSPQPTSAMVVVGTAGTQ